MQGYAATLTRGQELRARPDLTALPRIGIAAAIAVFLVIGEFSSSASSPEYFPLIALAAVTLLLMSGIIQLLTTAWHAHRLPFFLVGATSIGIFLILYGFDPRSYGIAIFWLVAELALLLDRPVVLAVLSAMAAGYVLNEIWIAPGVADDRIALRFLATLSVTLAAGSLTAAALAIRSAQREREIAARLRDLDEMKNMFLQAVSHELRTPLASVMGYALLLEGRFDEMTPAKRRASIEGVTGGARKLDKLLGDLLDVDRLGRGIVEPCRKPTDVSTLVRRVLCEIDLRDHPLETRLPAVVADIDGPKVERIVENLLSNAAKYSPPGAPITVRLERQGKGVAIEVEDRGPGVPDHLKPAVFKAFERGSEITVHTPGLGIGLALVSRFAELHDGRATVRDRPGGGSIFGVVLPG